MNILDVEDVLKTFSLVEQESARQYFAFQELREQHPEWGYKRLAKELGVNKAKTRCWKQKNGRPRAIKTIESLKKAGLLPFDSSDARLPIVLNILGSLYGDGGVDASLNNIFFSSSNLQDLEVWKTDLSVIAPQASENFDVIESGEYGHGNCLRCTNRAVIRFFSALGAPLGSKIINDYTFPSWLYLLSADLVKHFLDGFLACEVSVPTLDFYGLNRMRFQNFSFSLNKSSKLREQHLQTMREFINLLHYVGVRTTGWVREDLHLKLVRKDGETTWPYRIFISVHRDNILLFNNLFELRYASKKKARLLERLQKIGLLTNSTQALNCLPA